MMKIVAEKIFSLLPTMIVLDPDLDQDRTPPRRAARAEIARTPETSTKTNSQKAAPRRLAAERIPTRRTLVRYLCEAQAAVGLRGEVSVLLTTDRAIQRLNRDFRGKDKPTDVLSFPAEAGFVEELVAGDLAISVETARRQACEQGHALRCELKVLMLHGLLHLAGYDHETDAGEMARRERKLREKLRLSLGLIERVEQSSSACGAAAKKPKGSVKPKAGRAKFAARGAR